jgi:mono/diheme cytochrome c family protein
MRSKKFDANGWFAAAPGARNVPPWLALFLAGAILLLALPAARARQSDQARKDDQAVSGDVQHGKKIYESYGCYECHGREGQGAMQTRAPRIGPPPIPLEAFISYVRHPLNEMPPYTAKVASNQDLTDIYAFLKTIPKPPPGKDIPLLNK